MLSRQRQQRLHSSLQLFLQACRLWGRTFENDELLHRVEEMARELQAMQLQECPEEMVQQVEKATVQLIESMDRLFRSMGAPGLRWEEIKH